LPYIQNPTLQHINTQAATTMPFQWNTYDLPDSRSHARPYPSPCAPVLLDISGVLDYQTHSPILTITRTAVHIPSFLSSKPLLTVTRNNTQSLLGTIRFHKLSTSDVQIKINGREMVLTSSRVHKHWTFKPTSLFDLNKKQTQWYWKCDKALKNSIILVNAKKTGSVVARIEKNTLVFENADLSQESLDEIIMTAVALAEHARRRDRNADLVDLSQNIGDLVNGHHGGHLNASSHHHDGSASVGFLGGHFGDGGHGGGHSGGGGEGGGGGGGGGSGC
jgi:hypothetical protein